MTTTRIFNHFGKAGAGEDHRVRDRAAEVVAMQRLVDLDTRRHLGATKPEALEWANAIADARDLGLEWRVIAKQSGLALTTVQKHYQNLQRVRELDD